MAYPNRPIGEFKMKRVYAAAGLIVAAGAVTGYMLAPRAEATAPVETVSEAEAAAPTQAAGEERRAGGGGGGGGGFAISLPAGRGLPGMGGNKGAGQARPDCYFLRLSYNNAAKAGARSPGAARARSQAQQAGCYVPEQKS
jgi:hypothetical protein